jgi:hypothetical protein
MINMKRMSTQVTLLTPRSKLVCAAGAVRGLLHECTRCVVFLDRQGFTGQR